MPPPPMPGWIESGLAMVLLNATLNRVMIVELGLPATVVSLMVALPLLFAPARALVVPTRAWQAVSPHSGKDPLRDGQSGRQEVGPEGFGTLT